MTGPTKRRLEARIDDLEAAADGTPEEVIAPPVGALPVTVLLSARRETCIDEERRLHKIGGRLWRFPPDKHAAVMASEDS